MKTENGTEKREGTINCRVISPDCELFVVLLNELIKHEKIVCLLVLLASSSM